MRKVIAMLLLVPCIAHGFEFMSKTWMSMGCKVHVTVGPKENGDIGTFLVTVASSGKRDTVRVDRDGKLTGAWSADLDGDRKFEVVVASQSSATGNYGKVSVLTWTGVNLKKRAVPELNASQMKGYRGRDSFEIRRNNLFRTFPTFVQKNNDPAVQVGMRTLRLNLKKFRWENP